ncbi:MAG: hypothetical protein FWC92_10295 [Defluviitaleaceae bacterium]|nr:hypothetical protein [Defluviitaleaceae bacterium]
MSSKSSYVSDIISDIERGNSLLLTFGKPGQALKRKIALTGFICRILLFFVFNPIFIARARFSPDLWHSRKASAVRLVRLFLPYYAKGYPVTASPKFDGHIAIINHPTLNDPICAILYILGLYLQREIIIPMNLPWFESVCRYRSRLLKIGVNIVPILTPHTASRLVDTCKSSAQHSLRDDVSRVQSAFMANYVAEFASTLSRGGLAVVAQQATRRQHLFTNPSQAENGEDILSTVTLILLSLRRAKLLEQTFFIPVGVIPHSPSAKPGLNVFKKLGFCCQGLF